MAILLSAALLPACTGEQARTAETPAPRPAPQPERLVPKDGLLAAGDQVKVTVFGEDDLSGIYTVNEGGMLSIPLIGEIRAGGRTPGRLEREIAEKFRDGYLREPGITLEILRHEPHPAPGIGRGQGKNR